MSTTIALITLTSIFIIIGVFIPFLQEDLNASSNTAGIDSFNDDLNEASNRESVISGFGILLSILKMFSWSFGVFPFWLDLILLVPRTAIVILFILVIRGI